MDLLAIQGTLKSLLQHHSSKASNLRLSAFFIVQLSHPYMTIGKTRALSRRTFVGKVLSLLFNMLSRLVITFVPRSKRLFISWLQSPSTVILEPKIIKSITVSILSPCICPAQKTNKNVFAFFLAKAKDLFERRCVYKGSDRMGGCRSIHVPRNSENLLQPKLRPFSEIAWL